MMMRTTVGVPMDAKVLNNYFTNMVNLFFKILPLWENNEPSLDTYMRSLQSELLGCKGLLDAIQHDAMFVSLLSILEYLIEHPECENAFVKREVFRAISICNKLKARYPADKSEGVD